MLDMAYINDLDIMVEPITLLTQDIAKIIEKQI